MPRRRVIDVPGLGHVNPIPQGVVIGGMVFSSVIAGMDPATGEYLADPQAQVTMAFANLRRFLELAGVGTGDIAKMDVFLNDRAVREMVNREWVAMFPDAHDRPARHVHTMHPGTPNGVVLQLDIIALLPEGATG